MGLGFSNHFIVQQENSTESSENLNLQLWIKRTFSQKATSFGLQVGVGNH
jgi:hypothetical protein